MFDQTLWETDPARAAKLAFLEVQLGWHAQVEEGLYDGIPSFDAPVRANDEAPDTRSLKVVQPDTGASVYAVPDAVKRLFDAKQLVSEP